MSAAAPSTQSRRRQGARRSTRIEIVAALIAMLLTACSAPGATVEQAIGQIDRYTALSLRPPLPPDLVHQALAAIDRSDLSAALALMASDGEQQAQALAAVQRRWPGALLGRPDLVLTVGPYRTHTIFDQVPPGTHEVIPVQLRTPQHALALEVIVVMTDRGWRISVIR